MTIGTVDAICYVNFSGDLQTSECGQPLTAEDLDAGKRVTIYMSATTCPGCRREIQKRLGRELTPAASRPSETRRARRTGPSTSPPF